MTQFHDIAGSPSAIPSIVSRTPDSVPASASFLWRRPGVAVAATIVLTLVTAAYALHVRGQPPLALSLLFGATFGIVLQRARFCFFCMFRDWYDARDPRGLYGLLTALVTGIVGYTLVFGAWLPDAGTGRLPPDAFIGPVGPALILAGAAFGAGMAISGSCISAHLYRLGEGSPTAPFALIGTVAGFVAGFWSWTPIYLAFVADAPALWLPGRLGYAGALIAAVAIVGLIGLGLARTARRSSSAPSVPSSALNAVLVERWPAWIGGMAVGVLATAAYFRVAPLGVTAEISAQARGLGVALDLLPPSIPGLDTLRGCVSLVRTAALSNNGAFVLGLVAAAFAAALVAGQFRPQRPSKGQIARGLTGGLLLGWGAMTGLGCTVGTLLSGVMAGALSGWVFAAAIFAGTAFTLAVGRAARLLPAP